MTTSQSVMHIPTQVQAPLATVLLLASFALLVLSRRAVQKSRLHQTLDLAVSAPNIVLLAAHMGLSWSKMCETGREVIIGVSSLFPSLLVVRAIMP
jgi:type III secretory pathway component EscT